VEHLSAQLIIKFLQEELSKSNECSNIQLPSVGVWDGAEVVNQDETNWVTMNYINKATNSLRYSPAPTETLNRYGILDNLQGTSVNTNKDDDLNNDVVVNSELIEQESINANFQDVELIYHIPIIINSATVIDDSVRIKSSRCDKLIISDDEPLGNSCTNLSYQKRKCKLMIIGDKRLCN
jgi:hypothetical protein